MEEKSQNEQELDCNWNLAENVMGLVIKDKFKRKRKRRDSTGKRKKVTNLDLSKCVASEEDMLPDINTEEFTGAQRNEEDIGDQRKDFTGAHITGTHVTGTLNDNKKEFFTDDGWIVMGAPTFMGVHTSMERLQALHKRIYPNLQVLQAQTVLQVHNAVLQAPEKRI